MRHLKGLLHKKGGKPPSSSSSSMDEEGGDETPETESPTPTRTTEHSAQKEKEKEKKPRHKHKSGDKEHKHKHHTKRSRTHEDGDDEGESVQSQLRVCEPVKTPSSIGDNNSDSDGDREPPATIPKVTTSNSDSLDAKAIASAGFKIPLAPGDSLSPGIVVESRGRQRSGAFYDVALPDISDTGGISFNSKDLPQPSTTLKVQTGSSSLPDGVSWSLRFTIGAADTIGRRAKMEDTFAVIGQFGGMPMRDLFLVCDGHNGSEASQAVVKKLPVALQKRIGECSGDEAGFVKALKDAFSDVNDQLQSENIPGGSTATAIFADIDGVYVASVGDTRAVLIKGTNPTALTTDHRPSDSKEAAAVVARGGTISTVGKELRVNNILAVTRALGDPEVKSVISAEPDVRRFSFDFEPDSAIVIACDGLWDYLSEQDVADVIDTFKDPFCAAQELRNLAYQSGSTDNITVIVVRAAST